MRIIQRASKLFFLVLFVKFSFSQRFTLANQHRSLSSIRESDIHKGGLTILSFIFHERGDILPYWFRKMMPWNFRSKSKWHFNNSDSCFIEIMGVTPKYIQSPFLADMKINNFVVANGESIPYSVVRTVIKIQWRCAYVTGWVRREGLVPDSMRPAFFLCSMQPNHFDEVSIEKSNDLYNNACNLLLNQATNFTISVPKAISLPVDKERFFVNKL